MSPQKDSLGNDIPGSESEDDDIETTRMASGPVEVHDNKNRGLRKAQQGRSDDAFWSQARIKQADFYATAFFFEQTKAKYCWVEKSENDDNSTSPQGQLLDGIAHFFARTKNLTDVDSHNVSSGSDSSGGGGGSSKSKKRGSRAKSKKDSGESSSVDDVTATALGSKYEHEGQIYRKIYIAKNGGAQVTSRTNDKEFAGQLASWYNEGNIRKPSRQHPMWEIMSVFWIERYRHAAVQINKLNPQLSSAECVMGDPKFIEAARTVNNIPLTDVEYQRDVTEDWRYIVNLLERLPANARYFDQSDEDVKTFVNAVCFDDERKWRRTYQKDRQKQSGDGLTKYEVFRKLVKHLKRLKTLRSALCAFHTFQSVEPETRIALEFLPRIDIDNPHTQSLNSVQNSIKNIWRNTTLPEQDPNQAPAERSFKEEANWSNADPYVKDLWNAYETIMLKGLGRRFHCELQLLEIPEDPYYKLPSTTESGETCREDLFPYFGCSKRSCFLCWSILRKLHYSTMDTHGKLRANCAFPFTSLTPYSRIQVSDVIKDVYKRLRQNLGKSPSESLNDDRSVSDTATFYLQDDEIRERDDANETSDLQDPTTVEDPAITSSKEDATEDIAEHSKEASNDDDDDEFFM